MNATQSSTAIIFTAQQVSDMVKAGVIREDFMLLTPKFEGEYKVIRVQFIKPKSRPDVEMPLVTLTRSNGKVIQVWGSTLLSAMVLGTNDLVNTATVKLAGDRSVWFSDDFSSEMPHLNKLSDSIRQADGSMILPEKIEIVGATVSRSKTNESRWPVGFRFYKLGSRFLDLHNSMLEEGAKLHTWISEERLIELSGLSKTKRTFTKDGVTVTAPSTDELVINANADTDCRAAKANFIIRIA